MTRKTFWITLIVGGVLLVPPPVMAHHAVQGQFDFQKPLELSGVLTKMEWINPHAQMHLEVTNKNGTKTNWSFETINPTKLREKGLGRASKGSTALLAAREPGWTFHRRGSRPGTACIRARLSRPLARA